jgi:hypothetical protein
MLTYLLFPMRQSRRCQRNRIGHLKEGCRSLQLGKVALTMRGEAPQLTLPLNTGNRTVVDCILDVSWQSPIGMFIFASLRTHAHYPLDESTFGITDLHGNFAYA